MEAKRPLRVVTIGGGGGHVPVAEAVMQVEASGLELDVTAIVTSLDSGGSSGKLRDATIFGVGDLRRVISAFANPHIRSIFEYRSPLDGHTVGNRILEAVVRPGDDPRQALADFYAAFSLNGKVLPVTFQDAHVHARLEDGTLLAGEDSIYHADVNKHGGLSDLWVEPRGAEANPDAISAILDADFIVFCPGTLLCSILPPVLVGGVREALLETKATSVCIANLMNRSGHMPVTANVMDHVAFIERYLKEGYFRYVIYNTTEFPHALRAAYELEHKAPTWALDERSVGRWPIGCPLLDEERLEDKLRELCEQQDSPDVLASLRSPVSHDPVKLARALKMVFSS